MEKTYTKQTWEDFPSIATPINAERLNHIENGINNVDDALVLVSTDVSNLQTDMGDISSILDSINGESI